jgi:phospholipid/cholesterol/gamma-HCH transport system substrate-binding protein
MRKVLAACAAVLALAGCTASGSGGIYDMPLPGGADLGDHPYRVTVEFADVLDLVPQAAVKVNDVVVGRVESIELGGADRWTPQVVVAINGDVALPSDARASLRQSSLLGEKFVELAAPAGSTNTEKLADGAVITADRTNRHTEVEEVFGALSLLLNGGGIGQLRTINQELTKALSGNEPEIKAFLSNVDELVTNLDAHRGDITAALDGLNKLSATLASRDEQIRGALTDLTPGLQALTEQRSALVTMLQSLDTLSDVAVDTINRSRDDMIADLKALAPILRQLADAGQNLPQALEILPTFPFTDSVLDAA